MSKFELTKSIEAIKLHQRTGIPTPEPPITIPFGSIVENLIEDRDVGKFTYLGESYQCPYDVLKVAVAPVQPLKKTHTEAALAQEETGGVHIAQRQLDWQPVKSSDYEVMRAKVAGGWLVLVRNDWGGALTFYPDAEHQWDGASLP